MASRCSSADWACMACSWCAADMGGGRPPCSSRGYGVPGGRTQKTLRPGGADGWGGGLAVGGGGVFLPKTGWRSISCSCGGWPRRALGMAPGGYGKRARCGPAARGSTARGWPPEPGGHTRHSPPPSGCQSRPFRAQRFKEKLITVHATPGNNDTASSDFSSLGGQQPKLEGEKPS